MNANFNHELQTEAGEVKTQATRPDTDFIRLDDVLRIHADQINRYGGVAAIHEPDMLFSAIAQPRATFDGQYLHANLIEQAAALLFHLVQNHPFKEGNKRTGAVAALVFLALNGVTIESDNDSLYELVLDVARGSADKIDIARFLRNHAVSRETR